VWPAGGENCCVEVPYTCGLSNSVFRGVFEQLKGASYKGLRKPLQFRNDSEDYSEVLSNISNCFQNYLSSQKAKSERVAGFSVTSNIIN
jgi:hypothetical protein